VKHPLLEKSARKTPPGLQSWGNLETLDTNPWDLGVSHVIDPGILDLTHQTKRIYGESNRRTFQQGQQGMHQRLAQTHLSVTFGTTINKSPRYGDFRAKDGANSPEIGFLCYF
jgi:hypothetical protein